MKILPPSTDPWRLLLERRHDPPTARGRYGYRAYRPCLRWEFGFTCCFCLCHEADFAPRGAEGLGVTQVEHFVPVSDDEMSINIFLNCLYACIFCNQKRKAAPVDSATGARLLNPCRDVWEQHFVMDGDLMVPRENDADAAYTLAVYHLNDPRKVRIRKARRESIEECLDLIERGRPILARLLERARLEQLPELIDEAKIVKDALSRAWRDLEVYKVIPADAPDSCACVLSSHCSIPRAVEEQTLEIESLFVE